MTMELWYAPGTISLAVVIALEECRAKYVPMRLSFADNDQRGPAYLQINPKGRVPALVTEAGILTEVPAILHWIARTHPQAGLLPEDPFEAAQVLECCAYLSSTVHPSHAHLRRGSRWSDDPAVIEGLKVKVPANMLEHFTYLQGRIRGPWVMGDRYTIADPYLYTIATWLERDDVDMAQLPGIAAYRHRMQARPAVRAAERVMA